VRWPRWLPRRRQDLGSPRLRVALGAAASVAAVATAGVAGLASVQEMRGVAAVTGAAGVVAIAAAAWWRGAFVVLGLPLLGVASLAPLERHAGTAWAVLALTALLVLTGDLTTWASELRTVVPVSPEVVHRRVTAIAVHQLGTVAVVPAVLAVARVPAPGGLASLVLGTLAAVGAVALVLARPEG